MQVKMERGTILEKGSQDQTALINVSLVQPGVSDVVLLSGTRKKMSRIDTWKNRASAQQWALPDATVDMRASNTPIIW